MRVYILFITPHVRRIRSGMRRKPFFAGMLLDDSACTTVAVLDGFRNAQEGEVNVRESPRESKKETERSSLYGYVLFPSLSIVGYLNFVAVDGETCSFEFSLHSTGV